jgi:hypothetical protein
MTLYAYCLSDEVRGAMLEDAVGVGGARARLLSCGDVQAVVSDFAGGSVVVERENVFAHERVIRRVLREVTPLPFRFGTLVTEERLLAYVEENRAGLMKSLERVRSSVEMSVKIIVEAAETEEVVAGGAAEKDEGKGTAYLSALRREIHGEARLKERAEELAAWLKERVGDSASEHDLSLSPFESLAVRAAFLVRREHLANYRRRVDEARHERSRLRFLTSGPWPPYSFSNIKP